MEVLLVVEERVLLELVESVLPVLVQVLVFLEEELVLLEGCLD
jgi:hypothetical protein